MHRVEDSLVSHTQQSSIKSFFPPNTNTSAEFILTWIGDVFPPDCWFLFLVFLLCAHLSSVKKCFFQQQFFSLLTSQHFHLHSWQLQQGSSRSKVTPLHTSMLLLTVAFRLWFLIRYLPLGHAGLLWFSNDSSFAWLLIISMFFGG